MQKGAYLVPVVVVDGGGVAGGDLCGSEETVGDGGDSTWPGSAGPVADRLGARAEIPRGHAGVGGRGREHQLLRRRRHVGGGEEARV